MNWSNQGDNWKQQHETFPMLTRATSEFENVSMHREVKLLEKLLVKKREFS